MKNKHTLVNTILSPIPLKALLVLSLHPCLTMTLWCFVSGTNSYFTYFSLIFLKYKSDHVFPLLSSSVAFYLPQNKIKTPKMAFRTMHDTPCLPLQSHLTPFFPMITIS